MDVLHGRRRIYGTMIQAYPDGSQGQGPAQQCVPGRAGMRHRVCDQHAWNRRGERGRFAQNRMFKRGDDHGARHPGAPDGGHDRRHPGSLLDFNLHEHLAARERKGLLQGWNRFAPDAQIPEFGTREIGHPAGPPRQPSKIGIVKDNGDAVARCLGVQLDSVRPKRMRAGERAQRVFRSPGGGAPVGDAQGGHRFLRFRIGGRPSLVYSAAIL